MNTVKCDYEGRELGVGVRVTTNMCECFEQKITTEQCFKCKKLRYTMNDEVYPEHYGPYGTACMNTGQFDAGECWMCYMRRKKKEVTTLKKALDNEEIESECWEAAANGHLKQEKKMQLIAGKYQYQFKLAMRCINSIDDLFEYRHIGMTPDELQIEVRKNLALFTQDVSTPKQIKLKE